VAVGNLTRSDKPNFNFHFSFSCLFSLKSRYSRLDYLLNQVTMLRLNHFQHLVEEEERVLFSFILLDDDNLSISPESFWMINDFLNKGFEKISVGSTSLLLLPLLFCPVSFVF